MLERFDDDAHRRVVVLAHEEARALGHDHIGPEHILLALTRSGGAVSELLVVQGMTRDATREVVVAISGRSSRPNPEHLPFTEGTRGVLKDANRSARDRDDAYVTPAHLLLALLAQTEGAVDQVFTSLVDDREVLRQAALTILDGPPESDGGPDEPGGVVLRAVAGGPFPMGPPGGNVPRCSLCGRPEDPDGWSVVARGTIVCGECLRQAGASIDAAAEAGDAPTRLRYTRAGSEPADTSSARAAIDRCFAAVFPGRPVGDRADRTWAVEPGEGVADDLAVMEEGATNAPMAVVDVTVERVTFIDPEHAEVSVGIWMAGNPSPMLLPGQAVVVDGTWLVSRDTLAWFAGHARQFRRRPGQPWG